MLRLKEANIYDIMKEYDVFKILPPNENGFENEFSDVDYDTFVNNSLPYMINSSKGIGLPNGYVPQTYYFIWNDNEIIGLLKIRHNLNDFLAKGPGHMGFSILPKYRNKGYATMAVKLGIDKCREIIKESEIYLSCLKTNIGSLKAQQKNGAYIHHEDEKEYYNRIKIR